MAACCEVKTQQADGEIHEDQLLTVLINRLVNEVCLNLGKQR